MKEIWAIIRRDKTNATKKVLDSMGLGSMTVHSVQGRGKQMGFIQSEAEADMPADYATSAPHLFPTPASLATEGGRLTRPVTYIPKKVLTMVVPDEMVKEAVDAIISANQTGRPGDGKIFVMPCEEAYRVRTGEHGEAAVY